MYPVGVFCQHHAPVSLPAIVVDLPACPADRKRLGAAAARRLAVPPRRPCRSGDVRRRARRHAVPHDRSAHDDGHALLPIPLACESAPCVPTANADAASLPSYMDGAGLCACDASAPACAAIAPASVFAGPVGAIARRAVLPCFRFPAPASAARWVFPVRRPGPPPIARSSCCLNRPAFPCFRLHEGIRNDSSFTRFRGAVPARRRARFRTKSIPPACYPRHGVVH